MIHPIFDELKLSGRLPSPAGVGLKILHLTGRDDSSTEELARVIVADPALTGQLLRLANSAQVASIDAITTVPDAAARLGAGALRDVALSLSLLANNRRGGCARFDHDRFWSASLARAVAAQHASLVLGLADPAEAYTIALLSDIGTLSLASIHPEPYAAILAAAAGDARELARLEQEAFEIDHDEVAACLLAEWGLPASASQAVLLHERSIEECDPPAAEIVTMIRLLRLARKIAEPLSSAGHGQREAGVLERSAAALERACSELGIEADAFVRLLRTITDEWEQWTATLDLPRADAAEIEKLIELVERPGRDTEERPAAEGGFADESDAPDRLAPPDAGTGLRILAVDDDPLSLKILERNLRAGGHEVRCASGGREALELALTTEPQMVIADWVMPEFDGLDLCRALRSIESGRDMYFLLLTGRAEEQLIVQAFDAGIDDFVSKPCSSRVLMARLKGGQRVIRLMERIEKDRRVMMQQIADTAKLRRRLHMASLTDALTGLPNRLHAINRLTQEWQDASRSGRPLTVVAIDIDHFQSVNDAHGHEGGDAVLKEVSRVMREKVRHGEEPARLGGEEFLVICSNTTREQAAVQAERVRAAVEASSIEGEGFTTRVTVSLGVAERQPWMAGHEGLIKAADEAVQRAKAGGRNRVVIAGHEGASSDLGVSEGAA